MIIETLPFDRYSELLSFEHFKEFGLPGPLSIVVVARDHLSKEIKGYWVSQAVMHSEPVYLAPEVRNGLTGQQLFAKLMAELFAIGVSAHFCFSASSEISNYLDRLGLVQLPWDIYMGAIPAPPPIEEKE